MMPARTDVEALAGDETTGGSFVPTPKDIIPGLLVSAGWRKKLQRRLSRIFQPRIIDS